MRTVYFLMLCGLAAASSFAAPKSQIDFSASYNGAYESNIYHSYYDSVATSGFLNVLEANLLWRYRFSPKLTQDVTVGADLDLYPSYSKRNRSSIGLAYAPTYRYMSQARIGTRFSASRRNKDLIDDTGTLQTRTLKRWEMAAGVWHQINFGRLRLDQSFDLENQNYDEEPGLTSYDYSSRIWKAGAHYRLGRRLELRGEFTREDRDYDKRKTYSIQYGAFANRPFAIRSFGENSIEADISVKVWRKNEVTLTGAFTDRNDNLENFYGFMQRRYEISAKLYPAGRHQTKISFEFKNKDYPNYWNSSIGRAHRVHIDYSDFQIEHRYMLSDLVTIVGAVRSYNKVSNYWVYDYRDLTGGVGLEFTL